MSFSALVPAHHAAPFVVDDPFGFEEVETIRLDLNDHETRMLSAESRLTAVEPAAATSQQVNATHGGYWVEGVNEEEVTLATGAAFTDSAANLLPARSEILAVLSRVTVTITTAVNWKTGDATVTDRFTSANAVMSAGTTDYGFRQGELTGTSGRYQTAAAKVRITMNANPGAGKVRLQVFYRQYVAPTS